MINITLHFNASEPSSRFRGERKKQTCQQQQFSSSKSAGAYCQTALHLLCAGLCFTRFSLLFLTWDDRERHVLFMKKTKCRRKKNEKTLVRKNIQAIQSGWNFYSYAQKCATFSILFHFKAMKALHSGVVRGKVWPVCVHGPMHILDDCRHRSVHRHRFGCLGCRYRCKHAS